MAQRVQLERNSEGIGPAWDRTDTAASAAEAVASENAASSYSPLEFGLDLQGAWSLVDKDESGGWPKTSGSARDTQQYPSARRSLAGAAHSSSLGSSFDSVLGSSHVAEQKWPVTRAEAGTTSWPRREPPGANLPPTNGTGAGRASAPPSPNVNVPASGAPVIRSSASSPLHPRSPKFSSNSSLATTASVSSPGSSLAMSDRRGAPRSHASSGPRNNASGAAGMLSAGANTAQLTSRPGVYPCREGAPDCLHYLKTGRCQFGARCKFNHPPRDARLIDSLNRRDCFDWVMTGSCPYGSSCKYNHPALDPAERPMRLHHVSGSVGAAAPRDARRRSEHERAADAASSWLSSSVPKHRSCDDDTMCRAESTVSIGSAPTCSPTELSWSLPSPREQTPSEKHVGSWPGAAERSSDPLLWSPSQRGLSHGRSQPVLKPFNAAPGTPVHRSLPPPPLLPPARSPHSFSTPDTSGAGCLSIAGNASLGKTIPGGTTGHSPASATRESIARSFHAPLVSSVLDVRDHVPGTPGTNVNAVPFAASPVPPNTWTTQGYWSGPQRPSTEPASSWNEDGVSAGRLSFSGLEAGPGRDAGADPVYTTGREMHEWQASVWSSNDSKALSSSAPYSSWPVGRTPNEPELTAEWLDDFSPPLRASAVHPTSLPTPGSEHAAGRSTNPERTTAATAAPTPSLERP
jgi:hypothetical protein